MNACAIIAILVLLIVNAVFLVDIWRLFSYNNRLLRRREDRNREHPDSQYPQIRYTGSLCPRCGKTKPRNMNGLCLDCIKGAMQLPEENRVEAVKEWFRKYCHGTPIGTPSAWAELKDAIALRSEP